MCGMCKWYCSHVCYRDQRDMNVVYFFWYRLCTSAMVSQNVYPMMPSTISRSIWWVQAEGEPLRLGMHTEGVQRSWSACTFMYVLFVFWQRHPSCIHHHTASAYLRARKLSSNAKTEHGSATKHVGTLAGCIACAAMPHNDKIYLDCSLKPHLVMLIAQQTCAWVWLIAFSNDLHNTTATIAEAVLNCVSADTSTADLTQHGVLQDQ